MITELTRAPPRDPGAASSLRISFPDIETACRRRDGVVAAGAGVTRVELLDAWTIAAINAYSGDDYPRGAVASSSRRPGSEGAVAPTSSSCARSPRAEGATDVVAERDPDARARLWAARHDVRVRVRRRGAGDEAPLDRRLRAALGARRRGARSPARRSSGSGSTPASSATRATATSTSRFRSTPTTPTRCAASDELSSSLVDDALARGGTCTGEHGIGLGKIRALEREHGDLLPLMQAIKAAFDPNGIMNPGKVFARG